MMMNTSFRGLKIVRHALMLAALFAGAATLIPQTTSAQNAGRLGLGGMDLRLFRPAVDSKGFLSVNGTDILGHTDISFGLVVDGGFGLVPFNGFVNSMQVSAADAERRGRLVDYLFTGTLQANIGLFGSLELGAQFQLGAFSAGPNVTVPGVYNDPTSGAPGGLNYQGVGNFTLHGKLRILRAERGPNIGLAAVLMVDFPTGDARRFVGDNSVMLWPSLAGEWRPSGRTFRLGLNVGSRIMMGQGPTIPVGGRTNPSAGNATAAMFDSTAANGGMGNSVSYGPMLTYGLGAGLRLGTSPIELTAEAYGASIFSELGTEGGTSLEAMGGVKIFIDRNSYLVLAGGGGIPVGGMMQADARGMLGIIFEPSIGDRDGDGYRDDVDGCPDDPEDWDGWADEDGCPDLDNDRDGILDVDDSCPNVPEDRDGDQDDDGCPEGSEGDRDGDGILDSVDQCPDEPEDRDGFEDEDGCPDPDNDRDGILDVDDLCPNDPEDRDGFQDEDGCPEPDNDLDRILDPVDRCPNDPETYNGTEDEDGCPDTGTVIIEENNIRILEKVQFATDSAQILPESFPIVDAVAATLLGYPDITLVEVQGHADERSSDEYNIRLTSDRAASVVDALVQRGVQRVRLRSAGYGERCPLDPRHVDEAWERNRRVEFKIIATVNGPTGVEVACPAGRELIPR